MNSVIRKLYILILIFYQAGLTGLNAQDTISFSGQLSLYSHYNPENQLIWWNGGRYIPQFNYGYRFREHNLIDLEASANIFGNIGWNFSDSGASNGNIKPYRLWLRYSARQFELRAGLQKINFGSASILRPLMWFDQIDPRDPLKLTDGAWGILARYYFLNNTNIWLWGLYGNRNLKGWESMYSDWEIPEYGGRIQTSVPKGEAALSYHHRKVDGNRLTDTTLHGDRIFENRFGFDLKMDAVVGLWLEASWSAHNKNLGLRTNQEIINAGIDYTFGIGNGLTLIYEQLIAVMDEDPWRFKQSATFSLVSLSYPIGFFDNLSALVYYDWTNNKVYNFLNWQKQFNTFTFYVMGYLNPMDYRIPTHDANEILYAGYGVQVMIVLNH